MAECGCNCDCGESVKNILVYACSGAANVAVVADKAAREISGKDGVAGVKMFCLAGLGAESPGMVQTARDADMNIVIDGCDLDCGKKIFEKAGVSNCRQVKVTDLGIEKGGQPVTDEQVTVVIGAARDAIAAT